MKPNSSSLNVLFVDDEANVRHAIERGLQNEAYGKRFAADAEEALAIMAECAVAVIVTDLNMPGMGGLELLRLVEERYHDTIRIVLTADSEVSTILSAIHAGQTHRYLVKPWKLQEELIPMINQALQLHQLMTDKQRLLTRVNEQNRELQRQNQEISFFKEMHEQSGRTKTRIMARLTREIIPFVEELTAKSGSDALASPEGARQLLDDMNRRGGRILAMLREVNVLLSAEESSGEER
jgi:DNA-binding NtrC family response regulator